MNKRKQEKGITLVALVITIIILLILAGVTINLTLGENGLIKRAKESANAHKQGEENDIAFMNNAIEYMEQYFNQNTEKELEIPPAENKLTQEEKEALKNNGIKELEKDEITNENLKDNENIKGVMTGEVPIPTGGEYKEGTKETGVVVAMEESEFVWVPVQNIDEMAVLQEGSTQNYQGVLYNFEGTTATKKDVVTIGGTNGFREPDIVTAYDTATNLNIINNILETTYANHTETAVNRFKEDLQKDFNKMVASVKKYKGFYVGRYETSVDFETKKAYSKVGVLPATASKDSANTWYGLYAYQKKMAEANSYTSVESSMIWGSNYDAILRWALIGEDAQKVTSTGNAAHNLSTLYETGKETITNKKDKINNIYDLEGNGIELVAETHSTEHRSVRGGYYGYNYSPSYRGWSIPTDTREIDSSRIILYIK